MYCGVEVEIYAFLTSALDGGEWLGSYSGHFTPGVRTPGTHWIGGRVGPRARLDRLKKYYLNLGSFSCTF